MVQNSDKTYGQLMQEAAAQTTSQEVGATLEPLLEQMKRIIEQAVEANWEKGIRGKYYIHIWYYKEPYANNTLHIVPQCRRTRPSPYQGHDHMLWSVEDYGKITPEWQIPCKEQLQYILNNPYKFDAVYVNQLRKYCSDKIEQISDYIFKDKVI